MSDGAIEIREVHKSYPMGSESLHVLRGLSFRVAKGEFVAIVGASGSGKSTLLHMAGLLDRPDRGEITLNGTDAASLSSTERNHVRLSQIGFVFQFYHLLPELNVLENVLLPGKILRSSLGWWAERKKAKRHARELLDELGIGGRLRHRPSELSGGEQQRVAIARALINGPRILLADEPTGNLDSVTGQQILDVLKRFHRELNQTVLMVTHDLELSAQADRVLHLRDGQLTD